MAYIKGGKNFNLEIVGLYELDKQFEKVGKMKKKYLTKAGREGMEDPLKDARANAPKGKTGNLKKSIRKKQETPNKRSKAVYRLRYDPKFTESFLKPTTGAFGGKTPFAYYPNSVEYGYKKKFGKVAGQYNMRDAIRKNTKGSLQKVVDSLNDSIDEILRGNP